jgi:hypothetical protein
MTSTRSTSSSSLLAITLGALALGCVADVGDPDEGEDEVTIIDAVGGKVITASADAHVDSSAPRKNFGSAASLLVDQTPRTYRTFLRFDVPAITGTITKAAVRLYVVDASSNGPALQATGTGWTERGITWANAPATSGGFGDLGAISKGQWVEFDVTSKVTGAGAYGFALVPTSDDGADFASRSTTTKPSLALTIDDGTSTPPPSAPALGGVYMGSFSYEAHKAAFGAYGDVETIYYGADTVTTPNIAKHQAQIDLGISPVISLAWKNGRFTRAQIAAWGPEVQSYVSTFVAGLETLSDYAKSQNNGTRVYFADEHEAVVKINQKKYTFSGYNGGVPTIADSAAAWNKIMGHVAANAPNVVRVYWYGGSAAGEDTFASLLTPSLIQMATFDPYRWDHNKATDTAQSLWGTKITNLKSQSWMRNADGSLKPWGLSEWGTANVFGDDSNATFVRETLGYLASQGATIAVYFNRDDAWSTSNFLFTDGSQPRTVAAYKTAQGY